MGRPNPKQLIVEGPDDLFAVAGLMSGHVDWPKGKKNAPVWIVNGGGVDKILERDYLPVVLKTPGLATLGVMLDADTNPQGRYASFRNLCSGFFPDLPGAMPINGLIAENPGQRIGLWIMPDNTLAGHSKHFCAIWFPSIPRHYGRTQRSP